MYCHVPILALILLAPQASARGPFFAPFPTDTETSWFLTPPPFASTQLGSTVNITWHSDRDGVRLLLHKRGYAGVQYIGDIKGTCWIEWTVTSNFVWDVEQPFALQATKPVLQLNGQVDMEDWWSPMFHIVEAGMRSPVGTATVGLSLSESTSSTEADVTVGSSYSTPATPDGYTSGEFEDDEGSKTRHIVGLVFGIVLGLIAVLMCLALCIWRIRRKQSAAVKAPTAADFDEVIKAETCHELPAERSVLDLGSLDEFAARYS